MKERAFVLQELTVQPEEEVNSHMKRGRCWGRVASTESEDNSEGTTNFKEGLLMARSISLDTCSTVPATVVG